VVSQKRVIHLVLMGKKGIKTVQKSKTQELFNLNYLLLILRLERHHIRF
jgi:hypothetical protein